MLGQILVLTREWHPAYCGSQALFLCVNAWLICPGWGLCGFFLGCPLVGLLLVPELWAGFIWVSCARVVGLSYNWLVSWLVCLVTRSLGFGLMV